MRDCHGNYMRWMHISPQKVDADAMARYGIIQVCPAGDKEREVTGQQWEQRLEVMRDSIIYFRNNPSILFWEAGNTIGHAGRNGADGRSAQAEAIRTAGTSWAIATMTMLPPTQRVTPIAEYYGVMIGQDTGPTGSRCRDTIFPRLYRLDRRDRAPLIEAEDYARKVSRRMWIPLAPPFYKGQEGQELIPGSAIGLSPIN